MDMKYLLATLILMSPLLAVISSADPGDKLYIAGDSVNVRSDPTQTGPVILQLDRGHELIEFGREGEWINVGIARTGGKDGWVHRSLVTSSFSGGGTTAPADPRFNKFREVVEAVNARARSRAGFDFFTKIENLGDGIVELTATEEWLSAPRANRESNLRALFNLWDAADGSGQAIAVYIAEKNGTRVMQRSRR